MLWELKESAEHAVYELKDGKFAYGARAIHWIRTATVAAKVGTVVTSGTLTELSTGTFSWVPNPTGKLVVINQSEPQLEIIVNSLQGDIFGTSFPYGTDFFAFEWHGPAANLFVQWSYDKGQWSGSYIDKEQQLVAINLHTTWELEIYASTEGVDTFAKSTVVGQLTTTAAQVSVDAVTYNDSCSGRGSLGSGCSWGSSMDRYPKATIVRNGKTWKIEGHLERDTSPYGGAVKKFNFSGTVAENGAPAGQLTTRLKYTSGALNDVAMVVQVHQDIYEPDHVIVVP